MTMHNSLNISSAGRRHRNVLTREERIAKLREDGRWDEGKSVFGLPKVRSIKAAAAKKKSAPKKEAAEAEATAEAVPGAAASGAAAEKPKK
jgi:small basic protein (TIGR04137 family)